MSKSSGDDLQRNRLVFNSQTATYSQQTTKVIRRAEILREVLRRRATIKRSLTGEDNPYRWQFHA